MQLEEELWRARKEAVEATSRGEVVQMRVAEAEEEIFSEIRLEQLKYAALEASVTMERVQRTKEADIERIRHKKAKLAAQTQCKAAEALAAQERDMRSKAVAEKAREQALRVGAERDAATARLRSGAAEIATRCEQERRESAEAATRMEQERREEAETASAQERKRRKKAETAAALDRELRVKAEEKAARECEQCKASKTTRVSRPHLQAPHQPSRFETVSSWYALRPLRGYGYGSDSGGS